MNEKVKIKFGNAPVGARFEMDGHVWVILENYISGRGLIVEWKGNIPNARISEEGYQQRCCWVDETHDFDSLIELI